MQRSTGLLALGLVTAVGAWSWATPAEAYIDPTAAGSALQGLYIMGVSLFMGLTLVPKKIAGFFGRLKARLGSRGDRPPDDDA